MTMKKKKKGRRSDEEDEVAEILVELKTRMDIAWPPLWNVKKKRSDIAVYPYSFSKPKSAASPLTPLSFPSSGDHSSIPIPTSTLNKESGHVKNMEELAKDNASLHQEEKIVEGFLDRVKHYNLRLNQRKQELSVETPNDAVQKQLGSEFPGTAANHEIVNDDVGPSGLPDLNAEPEVMEYDEGLDVNVVISNNRAAAAQARKNRRNICRAKNNNRY